MKLKIAFERMRQQIMANCRAEEDARKQVMVDLATSVGVFTSKEHVEDDLMAYCLKLRGNARPVFRLYRWLRAIGKGEGAKMPAMPSFSQEGME